MLKHLWTIAGGRCAGGPRGKLDDDVDTVSGAADLLHIGEFQLFEIAHRHWYGRDADTKALERRFVRYMFGRRAPAWVRHFARDVISRARDGRLDPAEFGLSPEPTTMIDLEAASDVALALVLAAAYAFWTFGGA